MIDHSHRIEADLRNNILPFWMKHAIDHGEKTFNGSVTNDLVVEAEAIRGALLAARILWTFSAANRQYGDKAYRLMADFACADLFHRYRDVKFGGFFWSTNPDGSIDSDRKQVYGQAFAVYALSEYYAATGEDAALDQAIAVYRLLEKHARDHKRGGYYEAFDRDWSPRKDVRLSPVDRNDPKSQNTMLHVMEAYTRLLEVWPNKSLRAALRDLVVVMLERVLDPKRYHLGLFFSADWKRTTDTISYGHDIEAAWLLTRAADVLGDQELAPRIKEIALGIADVTLDEGTNPEGGIYNAGDPNGVVDETCEWWPQAEAIVGHLNAWQLSGQVKYLAAAARTWQFIEAHLIDRKNGEWYRGITASGEILDKERKISFWKCPYHNGRMGLEVVARVRPILTPKQPP